MPIDKIVHSLDDALDGIDHGATVLVGGFGEAGSPAVLLEALSRRGLRDLTVVSNNAGTGRRGLAALLAAGAVRKVICSFPRKPGGEVFGELFETGSIELELVPQGTLSERIRAAGAGIGGFYTRTGADTMLSEGKERRVIDGKDYVLEEPLHADLALIKGHRADRWGNLVYRKTARNYGPAMATAATITVAEVNEIVELGDLDPEIIVTPGIYVDRVYEVTS
ncbi:3-oxoacid CoA-transferase subunit A [Gordonia terrae]